MIVKTTLPVLPPGAGARGRGGLPPGPRRALGPRTLDVDIVAYAEVVSDDPQLTLPHPRAHERAFVLAPWLDVDPEAALPGQGRVADLLAAVTRTASRPVPTWNSGCPSSR
ncbi:2-amino-4-hydroxy-6-hydroxymethyldihydropteridinediphosphokinase [Streptomyces violaceorubidus]